MKLSTKLQADYFFNVWVFVAVALTFLNDRFLKSILASEHLKNELGEFHSLMMTVIGKLSDFGGLFFFPVFLVYVGHRFFAFKFSQPLIMGCCLVTGVLFILFKYAGYFQNGLIKVFSQFFFPIQIVSDPTDLIALISIVFAFLFLKKFVITVQ